jgi:hypothetical protein
MEPLKGSEMLGDQAEDVSGRLGGLAEVVAGEASESEDDSVEEKTMEYRFFFSFLFHLAVAYYLHLSVKNKFSILFLRKDLKRIYYHLIKHNKIRVFKHDLFL